MKVQSNSDESLPKKAVLEQSQFLFDERFFITIFARICHQNEYDREKKSKSSLVYGSNLTEINKGTVDAAGST